MNTTGKITVLRTIVLLFTGLLLLAGCKDLFHPEGPKTVNHTVYYPVTFDATGGSPSTQTRTVASGSSVGSSNMPTAPTKSGYTFEGWYKINWNGDEPEADLFTASTPVYGNITVYASWTAVQMPSNLSLNDSLTWIGNNAVAGETYTITLRNNETIAPRTLSYSGKTVGITLTGGSTERTVSLSATGSLFTVGDGVTLTLGNNVTLRGRSDNELSNYSSEVVYVERGGKLVMKDGAKITGNRSSTYGSGVGIYGGTFIMDGGTISDNYVAHSGGGGAGVYLWPSSSNSSELSAFTMNGGIITNNTAEGRGAGILANGSNFTMTGGTISNNTARYGGGIYTDNHTVYPYAGAPSTVTTEGIFTMSGGTISGNTASYYGGGVYVGGGSTFIKQSGGTIYGSNASGTLKNTAASGDSSGHAVYMYIDSSPAKIRNTTAGSGVTLNSAVSGSAGGWE
jgi:uncharacterized repeat protein (TIGR02543 family)